LSINNLIYHKSYSPWEHILIDDFYDITLFSKMQKELVSIFNKVMPSRDLLLIDNISKFQATTACVASKPITESYLSLFDIHRKYTKATIRNQIIFCNSKVDYRIHDEKESKILSAVTYVYPEQATGTRLYYEDKSFCKDVSWQPNRMLIFCGQTGKTWHSYHSLPNTTRITINTFIETE